MKRKLMLISSLISMFACLPVFAVEAAKEIEDPYQEKEVSIFREEMTVVTAVVRFYTDKPNVPYMGIAEYYSMMVPGAEMEVVNNNDGTYLLTSRTGSSVADIYAETLTSDDISDFTNLMPLTQEGILCDLNFTVVMIVLIWKGFIPFKSTGAKIIATLCNPMMMPGIIGNLFTLIIESISLLLIFPTGYRNMVLSRNVKPDWITY